MGGREAHVLGFKPSNNQKMIVSCEHNETVIEMMMMMMAVKAPQI